MKIKAYKKDFDYTYTLGVFETIELLKNISSASRIDDLPESFFPIKTERSLRFTGVKFL